MKICTTTNDAISVHWAATHLQQALQTYVCPSVSFDVVNITASEISCLAVGTSAAKLFNFETSSFELTSLEEGYVMGPAPDDPTSYVLTGDLRNNDVHQRGTVYATIDFLEDIGLRFLDSKTTVSTQECPFKSLSALDTAALPTLKSYSPPLEYRQVLAWDIDQNSLFSSLSKNNGKARSKTEFGGGSIYASPPGFVHTSYSLLDPTAGQVPPPLIYAKHPEWFWGGPTTYGQLCWSNESLIKYVINASIAYLHDQPDATVISVSQNDNYIYCNSSSERKVYDDEGGSLIGPILRAVNRVADAVAREFPHRNVAIDTLAYQWTRAGKYRRINGQRSIIFSFSHFLLLLSSPFSFLFSSSSSSSSLSLSLFLSLSLSLKAPTKTFPRKNVIIRLCSIECNFGAPLSDKTNAKFQNDIVNWGKFSNRTWI